MCDHKICTRSNLKITISEGNIDKQICEDLFQFINSSVQRLLEMGLKMDTSTSNISFHKNIARIKINKVHTNIAKENNVSKANVKNIFDNIENCYEALHQLEKSVCFSLVQKAREASLKSNEHYDTM